jgi:hypothetical protein
MEFGLVKRSRGFWLALSPWDGQLHKVPVTITSNWHLELEGLSQNPGHRPMSTCTVQSGFIAQESTLPRYYLVGLRLLLHLLVAAVGEP